MTPELRASRRQERRLANRTGGRVSQGSGNVWHRKGDVRTPGELYEAKWTGKKQVTVKAEVLEKVHREAVAEGRVPVLGIELNGRHYVVLGEDDYLEWRDVVSATG